MAKATVNVRSERPTAREGGGEGGKEGRQAAGGRLTYRVDI